jgi:hypothetical protein
MSPKTMLDDGCYDCSATLHIKDGKAVVVLHSMFGLKPGSAIPLLRKDHNLLVELSVVGSVVILNGHSII